MSFLEFSLRRPLTIIVMVIALLFGASMAIRKMPRDIFPPLGVPTIYVAQPYGGMDAAQMESYLTYFYEYHFLYIANIEHVESKTIQGASIMKLQFHPGTDMAAAMAETIAYVNRARAFMPAGAPNPFVTRFDAGSVPVGYLTFDSDNPDRTVGQMQDEALNKVRPLFATLPGVSAPPPFGGSARTVVVNIDPDRLRARNLSPDEVVTAIAKANVLSPSGNMILGDQYPIVPTNAIVQKPTELADVAIRNSSSSPIFVRDVASVSDAADLVTSYALVNGRRTVYIPVTKRAEASTLAVVSQVRSNIQKFQAVLPPDIKVSYEFDQSPLVWQAIRELSKEAGLGALLSGLMVLLFLRSFRSAFIVVINIPLSLLAATLALWITGQSVNLMTLGGLALAVGILVDEATVAIENIHARLAHGESPARASANAIRETATPRFLAMLCILAMFIPAFFMEGAAGSLFKPLALSVGFSMIASFLLSSTLVPILSIWLLRHHPTSHSSKPSFLTSLYPSLLKPIVACRWLITPLYLLITAAWITFAFPQIGSEIFPQANSGQFALRFRAPAGTKVELTESLAKTILSLVQREAGPQAVSFSIGLVGVHAPNYPVNLIHLWNGGPEEGWLAFQLNPHAKIDVPTLQEKLRATLANELPHIRLSFEPADITSRVMAFGSNNPIEIAIGGNELPTSNAHAQKILAELNKIPCLRDAQIAQELNFPSIQIQIDRERAGSLGVNVQDISRALIAATTSSRFTQANFWADPSKGGAYNVQVQIPQSETRSIEDLANIPIPSSHGNPVSLRSLASIAPSSGPSQYERYNMARFISITANYHGTDLGNALKQVNAAITAAGSPPPKTTIDLRGQAPTLASLTDGFSHGLGIAIAVLFLLLAANFQSWRLALTVTSTIPAVLSGVLLSLWLTHSSLNIQSAIGAIMAIGVAIANAILWVTFAERERLLRAGNRREAAILGASQRLRPILMTSCAMIAGMLPMSLNLSGDAPQMTPLAHAVIGGLIMGTLATLTILPAVFSLLAKSHTRSVSLDPDDPHSSLHSPLSH